ncbi:hypothetical protein [Flexithrix dorotheae]|uniref:hypothetical protein n=1 Tax=Flexithrix dorotheae TaxID=70993 RepID=UPI00037F86E1|nr:hypothetical protein [Flexithrix dorotheae]
MDNLKQLKPSLRKRQKRRDKRMNEELIECYRLGWRVKTQKGYNKKMVGKDFEFSPKQESIKIKGGNSKMLNDNLSPLIRFLDKRVGKYWDKVYAELCEKMDKNSLLGQHLESHLFDFVATKVEIENKKVYKLGNFGGRTELASFSRWPRFYVHPKSKVLLKAKKRKIS